MAPAALARRVVETRARLLIPIPAAPGRIRRRLLLTAGCLAALAPAGARAGTGSAEASLAGDAPITFSAIADAPYSESEVTIFQQHMNNHNLYSPSDFLVHLGDILSATDECSEFRYQRMADLLHTLAVPAFIVPGDNETTDCTDPVQGWQYWRQYFLGFEASFCGTPAVEHQTVRPENFAFVKNGVLFVGINLVGGGNDTQIMQDDAAWVSQQFQAKSPSVRAAVLMAQAGPGSNRQVFYDPFVSAAAAFAKPVLLLHGDGHAWVQDQPFSAATNVLRVQLDRGVSPPVQVTVTLDTVNPFQFNRDPWPAGTPLYNRPPCVYAGPDQTIPFGQTAALAGQATDNSVPNNPPQLSYGWSKASGPGTVTFSAPNALATTAGFSIAGTYQLRLTVSDGALSASDDVAVYALDELQNLPPVAADDGYETERDAALVTAAPGVLGNDSDPEGAPLLAAVVDLPQHGTLTLDGNGSFTYVPAPGYIGQDTFTYRASDGVFTSNIATVTIHIGIRFATFTPTHDARVKSSSPTRNYGTETTLRVEQDATIQHTYMKFAVSGVGPVQSATLRLYVQDPSPDGGSVYAVANEYAGTTTPWTQSGLNWNNAPVLAGPALAAAGAVSTNLWIALDVTAAIRGNGTFSFGMQNTSTNEVWYSSREGTRPPELVVVYRFGSAANSSPVAQDDAYALNEDATLTVPAAGVLANDTDGDGDVLTASLTSPPAHGSVALQATGAFTYIPTADFNGTDWFTYSVSDGRGGTDLGSVELTVHPVPDPPTAANDSWTLVVDDSLVVAAPGVLANDSDPDGDVLTAALLAPTVHGTLTLAADGSFTYIPAPGFIGTDSFAYRALDASPTGADATVTLQVTPPPPILLGFAPVADAYVSSTKPNTNYGTATELRVRDSTTDHKSYLRFVVSGFTGVLQSAKLRLYVTDGSSDGGTVYAVSNTYLGTTTPWTETGITWNNGPALDGTPLAAAGTVEVGTWVELDVTASISGDGTFCYGMLNRSSNVAKYGSRETANSPQLVLLVQRSPAGGNTPPVAGADSYAVDEDVVLAVAAPGVLGNDTDADGDPLTVTAAGSPAHGTLVMSADGSFTYTPQANYYGPDGFTYTVSDGRGGVASATVSLVVNAVNDAPVAADDSWAVTVGQALVVAAPGVLANDTDVEGSALSAVLVTGAAHGTLVLNADGSFTYTATAGFTGTDGFTYRASDGEATSADAAVTLNVSSGAGGGPLSVVFEEIRSGGSTGASTVTTGAALAAVPGHLYLAAIASKSANTVTNVSGLGLVWTRLRSQCGGRGQTGVEVWMGRGAPVPGTVTATFQSAPQNAVLLAARYSGTDPTSPVGNILSGNTLGVNGICSGGTDSGSFAFNLTSANGNLVFGAVASRGKTLTPGAGYTKRGQIFQGADSGSMATVSVMDKPAAAGTTLVDGTFGSTVDWAVVTVEIRPQALAAKTTAALESSWEGLLRIYPNPFKRGTWIEYDLPAATAVEAVVYNARGQQVRTLAAETQVAGRWRLYWDGRNDQGAAVAAGMYFLRTRLGDALHTRKIVMQR